LTPPVFLYGTLLDPRVLARRSGDARLARQLSPATLSGWRRVQLRGTPYPTLVRGAGHTAGALLRPTHAAMQKLAAYEGASYRLLPVRVTTRRGPRFARAWMAPPWRAAPMPWP